MSTVQNVVALSPGAATSTRARPDWVDTPTSQRIASALSYAQAARDVVLIFGGPGVGKSDACSRFARNGNSYYLSITPASTGVVPALEEITAALGCALANGAAALHRALVERMRYERADVILIVDEAQRLSDAALDQVGALHDATGCSLVLVGNRDLYGRLNGGDGAASLDGLRSRIGKRVNVNAATADDVAAILDGWGVKNDKVRKPIIAGGTACGLRVVIKALRLAALLADTEGRAMTDADVRTAWRELGST